MRLVRDAQALASLTCGVVATVGNFDGVHLGHQQLIKLLRKKAQELRLPSIVILFEPQPKEYFYSTRAPSRLSTLRDKLESLKACGIDYVFCISFTPKVATTDASEFAQSYLFSTLKVRYLLVGKDFRFGKDRLGGVALLKRMAVNHQCEVITFPDFIFNKEKVSSTLIRKALKESDFSRAAHFLGRSYSLYGRVIYGEQRGRQWGIPTTNLLLRRLVSPLNGVYAVKVLIGTEYFFGVANIGSKPTVGGVRNSLEVHLFHFNKLIYGRHIRVYFVHKLRDEARFSTVEALIAQIRADVAKAQQLFNEQNVLLH